VTTPAQQYQDTPHDQNAAAILATYLAASAALRSRLLALVTSAYAAQGNYYDAAATAFVSSVVPAVQAAQTTMAALTSAYLAHLISAAAGGTTAPVAIPREALSNLRGIDPAEVYRRPYEQVWTALSQGKSLADAVEIGQRRAVSLASTDLQLAKTRASQIAISDDRRVVGYRRVLVGAHSCGLCVVASSVRYRNSDLLPIHPGCVIGSTPVSNVTGTLGNPTLGVNVIKAATRRSYAGKLITITTARGQQVTITPNHPVLTDQGWIPADFIHEGDQVFCGRSSHRTVGSSPDEEQTPALIEDVWRSTSMSGFITVPLSAKDFHGDGSDSEVDIVYTDGNFSPVKDVPNSEPVSELLLMNRHGARVLFPSLGTFTSFLPRSSSTSSRDVRCASLSSSFLSSHLRGTHQPSFRTSTGPDTAMCERPSDGATLRAVERSQSKFGFSLQVTSSNLGMREFSPSPTACRFDPSGSEFLGQGLGVYGRLGRSLSDRLAGQVQTDRVVSVETRDVTSCHVFNLHTGEGWYRAGGLIVSNCDCAVAPILGRRDPGRTIDSAILSEGSTEQAIGSQGMKFFSHDDVIEVGDLLGPAHQAVEDTFGQSAADAHQIDYRKVILVRNHSELGPTLTVASHDFTKKQIESGDLQAKAGTYHKQKGRVVTNIGE
jgi:hypothetical protein